MLNVINEATSWLVYDNDFQRSIRIVTILSTRCRIQAVRYQKGMRRMSCSKTMLLVHCDALNQDFNHLAILKLTGKYNLRFYCTDRKDRIQEIAYLPDELDRLVS